MYTFTEDDFQECKEIGYGGEGSVHRAKTQNFGVVAVKVFHPSQSVNVKEIENMRKLSFHPNIVQFFGVYCGRSKLSPQVGYVMKYMPLGSVYNAIHIDKLNYSMDTAFSWILQAARAIAYLHDCNVIHRDIKPANMLLANSRKTVLVSDFGLAKINEPNSKTSFQGSTYIYQAPEIFVRSAEYRKPSDVYSFAISMWEIITKRVPYDDNDEINNAILALPQKVCKGTRPSLDVLSNADIADIVCRSWDPEPNIRPSMQNIVTFFNERVPKETLEGGDCNGNSYNDGVDANVPRTWFSDSCSNSSTSASVPTSSARIPKLGPHPKEKEVWQTGINQGTSAKQLMSNLTDLIRDYKRLAIMLDKWSPFTFTFSKLTEPTQESFLSYIREHGVDLDHVLHLRQKDVEQFYSPILRQI